MTALEEKLARFRAAGLYVVITEAFCAGRSSLAILEACLDAGVQLVQFREKDGDDRDLYEKAIVFREHTHARDALLIIDDRVDLALAVHADGVHLGQSDLPIEAAHRIAPDLIIGASTHSIEEADAALAAGASYINVGPVFATQTKATAMGPVGLALVADVRARHPNVAMSSMGGIKLDTAPQAIEHGADVAAVVTAVTAADDPEAAARELLAAVRDVSSA